SHSLTCTQACRDIRHLPVHLKRHNSYEPWPSIHQMDFTIKHYIQGGLSDKDKGMNDLLNDIHFKYSPNNNIDIPLSLHDMKHYLRLAPQLMPHILDNCPKTPLFSIKEILSNIMADSDRVSQMEFG